MAEVALAEVALADAAPLFVQARAWLAAGHDVALVTVIQTWGSAPRPVGAHMIVRDDGAFEGSVSGGCVEGEVIANAQAAIRERCCRRLDFGVSDARAWEAGLACGGRIALFIQPLDDAGFPPSLLDELVAAGTRRHAVAVTTDLHSGRSSVGPGTETGFHAVYAPARRLAIIGAVHIAQALLPIVRQLGHEPLVIDPRGAFATRDRFPDVALSVEWPDEALDAWCPDRLSAVVTLTHDPKLDDPALIRALRSQAYYIAALGSRKTHAARLERLRARGFSDIELARIHGPAGLAIGARSPAEIAVSIAAQMTAARRQAPVA